MDPERTQVRAEREQTSSGRGLVAVIGGGLAGMLLFGPAGYILGLGFLDWFGPESCCGLEGLLAPAFGLAVGGGCGLVAGGAKAWRVSERNGPFRPALLLFLLVIGWAAAWVIGHTVFTFDYEDVGGVLTYFVIALGMPLLLWGFWPSRAPEDTPASV